MEILNNELFKNRFIAFLLISLAAAVLLTVFAKLALFSGGVKAQEFVVDPNQSGTYPLTPNTTESSPTEMVTGTTYPLTGSSAIDGPGTTYPLGGTAPVYQPPVQTVSNTVPVADQGVSPNAAVVGGTTYPLSQPVPTVTPQIIYVNPTPAVTVAPTPVPRIVYVNPPPVTVVPPAASTVYVAPPSQTVIRSAPPSAGAISSSNSQATANVNIGSPVLAGASNTVVRQPSCPLPGYVYVDGPGVIPYCAPAQGVAQSSAVASSRVNVTQQPVYTAPAPTSYAPPVVVTPTPGPSVSTIPSVCKPGLTPVTQPNGSIICVSSVPATQLPSTGLPVAAAALSGLFPLGWLLRRFGSSRSEVLGRQDNHLTIWRQRQYDRKDQD